MSMPGKSMGNGKKGRATGRVPLLILGALAAAIIAGCASHEYSDLEEYVAKVKAKPPGRIPPLPEFETYETFAYTDQELRDPFVPKDTPTLAKSTGSKNGLAPPKGHRPEALEAFPLDALEYVGLLQNKQETWALIKAPDNVIYRAKVGNYAGQNYGQITSVSETTVQLVEIVADGLGGWMKRDAAIALKE